MPDGTPRELADRAWLAARYQHAGDAAIARELGVSTFAVRLARERFGIPAQPPGRRRGVAPSTIALNRALELVADEAHAETEKGTVDLLAARVSEAGDAAAANDDEAFDRSLIRLASAAVLLHAERARAA